MLRLDGRRDPERREAVERNDWEIVLGYGKTFPNGKTWAKPDAYQKTALTYAIQIPAQFTVETIEGNMLGMPGDYLAIGPAGEMYPVAKDIFEGTYKLIPKDENRP